MSTEISAKDVMALRNETGLPMMDCKQALAETKGDVEAAKDYLRKKLKGKMDLRTDRAAGEGRIAIAVARDGKSAAMVEIRAETDFTAKTAEFQAMAQAVAEKALAAGAGAVEATPDIRQIVDAVRIATSENISYARGVKLAGGAGTVFGTYVHFDGKKGVLLQAEGTATPEFLKDVCMHITAATPTPLGVSPDSIPQDAVERERKFAIEQAMESGKPREIAEKMVEGKIRKYFEEVALLEQPFVMDQTKKVKDLLPKGATIKAFARWQVGGA